jgi:hypothetical protein
MVPAVSREESVPNVPAVPREEPVPNVPAVSIVPTVSSKETLG